MTRHEEEKRSEREMQRERVCEERTTRSDDETEKRSEAREMKRVRACEERTTTKTPGPVAFLNTI
jgi:hypothetical protein